MRILTSLVLLMICHHGFSQYEEQYLKVHAGDSVKSIKVWYFDNGTKVDFVKHQGYRYYIFGKHGKLLTSSCYNEKNKLVWEYKYSYDSLYRMTKEIYNYVGQPLEVHTFTYNKPGATGEVHEGITAMSSSVKLKRDTADNIVEKTSFYDDKVTAVYKYEYTKFDGKNNWTEMIRYDKDKPFRKYIRKLVYY